MNQDTRDLIVQLCSCAGSMMEDASVPAVTTGGVEDEQLALVLRDLNLRASQISALLAAATSLTEWRRA